MSFTIGKNIKVTISGASHAPSIGVKIEGIPRGHEINMFDLEVLLDRRASGKAVYTTARREADKPVNITGLDNNVTTGETISAQFINSNARSSDYANTKFVPRPSHADFAAYTKYKGNIDLSGGGFFSGRMTLPMCFAGAICKQLLEEEGILIGAHISSVKDVCDDSFDPMDDFLEAVPTEGLPVLNEQVSLKMEEVMINASKEGDSVGGVIECKVVGMPIGVGDPVYDSIESRLSFGMFGIPAVKGIEFGTGFDISKMNGSTANDNFEIRDGKVRCSSNNSGGIQGGLSNGMPIIFRVCIKPVPSIYKEQQSVDLKTMTQTSLKIEGRHDSCIVPRAVPCVEAMCAIVLYDLLLDWKKEQE